MAQVETFEVRKKTFLPLPIVAPDFSYTMDLMIMSSVYQNIVRPGDITKFEWRRTELNNRTYNNNYQYILIFIETTSRKVWVFPQKTKTARETYKNFILFRTKVNNRISRLLSDNDGAFELIRQNCSYFNYQQVVAGNENHRPITRADRFIKTLRGAVRDEMEDAAGKPGAPADTKYRWLVPMWKMLHTYNDTPHRSLWLNNTNRFKSRFGIRSKFLHYTPNEAWKSPKLRYRIRLRDYLRSSDNYNKMFDRIAKSNYVYKRVGASFSSKGVKYKFAQVPHRKGFKYGNSFMVDGELIPFRNLYPAPDPVASDDDDDDDEPPPAPPKKKSKYRRFIPKGTQDPRPPPPPPADDDDDDDDDDIPSPQPERMRGRRAWNEARNLAAEARDFIRHEEQHRQRSGRPPPAPRRR